ncbi:hypothetical protein KC320_g4343 [Hortaea werneckii]|nr:hypothetical protein KC320_g4343 [Hortaea werneckii]
MATTNPHGNKVAISSAYLSSGPMTLTVKQKYWSWFKNTGRGFTVTNDANSDLIFALSTKRFGKRRYVEDAAGATLFELERHWYSRHNAWILKSPEGDTILSVRLRWSKFQLNLEVEWKAPCLDGSERDVEVHVEGGDVWHEKAHIKAGGSPIAQLRCTNTVGGFLSSYKVTPPVWEVHIGEGVDMALASILVVCASDVFSEGRIYMV